MGKDRCAARAGKHSVFVTATLDRLTVTSLAAMIDISFNRFISILLVLISGKLKKSKLK